MRPTMIDVAKRAGVSVKTVSNVLSGYPHVRESTRERVMVAVAELDYRLNVAARSLRSGRSRMLGLAVPELKLPYFAELADSVIVAAERRGLTVLIEQTNADRERELEVLHGPRRHLTDGVIFSPLALGQDDRELFRVDVPMVMLGERLFGGPIDHVTMDNVEAARAATEYLIGLGRRRIAVLGAHPGEAMGTAALRIQGYTEALAQAGLPFDPALVAEAQAWHRDVGAAAMSGLLDSGVDIDAVFALNDMLGLGALHVLHERRIDVPGQIAVIGFDDVDEAAYSSPPMSSVAPGREEIAETAVDLLCQRIDGAGPGEPVTVRAQYTIVVRGSTESGAER